MIIIGFIILSLSIIVSALIISKAIYEIDFNINTNNYPTNYYKPKNKEEDVFNEFDISSIHKKRLDSNDFSDAEIAFSEKVIKDSETDKMANILKEHHVSSKK
jgi:hypothetical protein